MSGNEPVFAPPSPTPSDETRSFQVRFQPPAGTRGGPLNDQGLSGQGTVEVTPGSVTFTEYRDGTPHKSRVFARADVANVEWSPDAAVLIVRTRQDTRFVAVWLASAEETAQLAGLLPGEVTAEFQRQRDHARDFEERMRVLAPRQWVTPTLIGLNLLMFAIMVYAGAGLIDLDPQVHVRFGSNFGPLTWTGEPWRLLTCAFIHFGVIHLALNLYALWSGGLLCEKLYGSARFLVLYLLAALAGSVVSGWWDAERNSAGASGAVFGVYGALLVFFAVRRHDIPVNLLRTASQGALLLLGYSLFIGATSQTIDNAAHVGGLLGGSLAGLLLVRPFDPAARARAQPLRVVTVAVLVCAALAALAWPLWTPTGLRAEQLRLARVEREFLGYEAGGVERFKELYDQGVAGKLTLPEAAARMEQEVIPGWEAASRPVLDLPPIEPPESLPAQRLALLQTYATARARFMHMLTRNWRGTGEYSDEDVQVQWRQVEMAIESLHRLDQRRD